MNRIEAISERALELASAVGGNVRHTLLPKAGQLLDAGAKLGVVKNGARVAGKFVRRNPMIVAAAVAGVGLLWYVAHRRAKRAERGNSEDHETIEGSARRVEAKRATDTRRVRTAGAGTRPGSRTRAQPSAHT